MRISTWHTNQPVDHERFHRALKGAFEKLGQAISFDDFKQAMTDLAEAYHPHLYQSFTHDRTHHIAHSHPI